MCSWVLFCQSQRGGYTVDPPSYTVLSLNFIYNAELFVLMVYFNSFQSTPSFLPLTKFVKTFSFALSFLLSSRTLPEGGSAALCCAYLTKLQFLQHPKKSSVTQFLSFSCIKKTDILSNMSKWYFSLVASWVTLKYMKKNLYTKLALTEN